MNTMYYDFSKIDGYDCPVKIVISRRGLGKTFGKLRSATERFVTSGKRFIYVVETGEMVKELTKNNGEKFWSALIEYYAKQDSARKRYFYSKLTSLELENIDEDNAGENDIFLSKRVNRNVEAKIIGGTIKINKETAGYIVDMNAFGELKRNNFTNVEYIIIDEFISEKLDKTSLDNPRKISSIIQSIGRLRNIKIYLLGNAVRIDDPILARMGFNIKGYGFHRIYDKYGLFAVLHYVNPDDYPQFAEAHEKSVAGRFASLMKETNEEENKFTSDLPLDRRLTKLEYKKNGYCLNLVKGDVIVSIKERNDGSYACVPFANKNTKTLNCLTPKEQGFKMGYRVICSLTTKDFLLNLIRSDLIYYYSEIEYNQLKIIIKGE